MAANMCEASTQTRVFNEAESQTELPHDEEVEGMSPENVLAMINALQAKEVEKAAELSTAADEGVKLLNAMTLRRHWVELEVRGLRRRAALAGIDVGPTALNQHDL